jgi:hypothetical protein
MQQNCEGKTACDHFFLSPGIVYPSSAFVYLFILGNFYLTQDYKHSLIQLQIKMYHQLSIINNILNEFESIWDTVKIADSKM